MPMNGTAIVRTEETVAKEINAMYRTAEKNRKEFFQSCSLIGDRLCEIKKREPKWRQWVEDNLEFSYSQASMYMRISFNWEKVRGCKTLKEAVVLLAGIEAEAKAEQEAKKQRKEQAAKADEQEDEKSTGTKEAEPEPDAEPTKKGRGRPQGSGIGKPQAPKDKWAVMDNVYVKPRIWRENELLAKYDGWEGIVKRVGQKGCIRYVGEMRKWAEILIADAKDLMKAGNVTEQDMEND